MFLAQGLDGALAIGNGGQIDPDRGVSPLQSQTQGTMSFYRVDIVPGLQQLNDGTCFCGPYIRLLHQQGDLGCHESQAQLIAQAACLLERHEQCRGIINTPNADEACEILPDVEPCLTRPIGDRRQALLPPRGSRVYRFAGGWLSAVFRFGSDRHGWRGVIGNQHGCRFDQTTQLVDSAGQAIDINGRDGPQSFEIAIYCLLQRSQIWTVRASQLCLGGFQSDDGIADVTPQQQLLMRNGNQMVDIVDKCDVRTAVGEHLKGLLQALQMLLRVVELSAHLFNGLLLSTSQAQGLRRLG